MPESKAKNWQYIERWIRENRKDLIPQLQRLYDTDACILLLCIGFSAGRLFQHENPTTDVTLPTD